MSAFLLALACATPPADPNSGQNSGSASSSTTTTDTTPGTTGTGTGSTTGTTGTGTGSTTGTGTGSTGTGTGTGTGTSTGTGTGSTTGWEAFKAIQTLSITDGATQISWIDAVTKDIDETPLRLDATSFVKARSQNPEESFRYHAASGELRGFGRAAFGNDVEALSPSYQIDPEAVSVVVLDKIWALFPDGRLVAYSRDGVLDGKQIELHTTTLPLVAHDLLLTPSPDAEFIPISIALDANGSDDFVTINFRAQHGDDLPGGGLIQIDTSSYAVRQSWTTSNIVVDDKVSWAPEAPFTTINGDPYFGVFDAQADRDYYADDPTPARYLQIAHCSSDDGLCESISHQNLFGAFLMDTNYLYDVRTLVIDPSGENHLLLIWAREAGGYERISVFRTEDEEGFFAGDGNRLYSMRPDIDGIGVQEYALVPGDGQFHLAVADLSFDGAITYVTCDAETFSCENEYPIANEEEADVVGVSYLEF